MLPKQDRSRAARVGDIWEGGQKGKGGNDRPLRRFKVEKTRTKDGVRQVFPCEIHSTGTKKTIAKWISEKTLKDDYVLVKKGP